MTIKTCALICNACLYVLAGLFFIYGHFFKEAQDMTFFGFIWVLVYFFHCTFFYVYALLIEYVYQNKIKESLKVYVMKYVDGPLMSTKFDFFLHLLLSLCLCFLGSLFTGFLFFIGSLMRLRAWNTINQFFIDKGIGRAYDDNHQSLNA